MKNVWKKGSAQGRGDANYMLSCFRFTVMSTGSILTDSLNFILPRFWNIYREFSAFIPSTVEVNGTCGAHKIEDIEKNLQQQLFKELISHFLWKIYKTHYQQFS